MGLVSSDLYSLSTGINNRLDDHIQAQTVELSILKKNTTDEIEQRKRYDFVESPSKIEQQYGLVFKVDDYAANHINAIVPNNQIKSVANDKFVGYMEDVGMSPDDGISSFTAIFPNRNLVPQIKTVEYHFTPTNRKISTGYQNYVLEWNGDGQDVQITLEVSSTIPFLSVTTSGEYIGKIIDYEPYNEGGHQDDNLISGQLVFETRGTELSGINGKSLIFTNDMISVMLSDDEGIKTLVSFDHYTQLFTIKDKYSVQMYQSLSDSVEFGRIYENMVSYQPYSASFQNLSVRLEETSAVYELVSDGVITQADIDSEHFIKID